MILLAEDFGIISGSWYHVYLGTVLNTMSYIIVCVILPLNLKLEKKYLAHPLNHWYFSFNNNHETKKTRYNEQKVRNTFCVFLNLIC